MRMFPHLARLNVVRIWTGIRVMPQDGFPIYDQSETHPGAFVACCHSGVTLASNHAFEIARMVAQGRARTGAGRRVLGQPLRRRRCCEQQRLLEISDGARASMFKRSDQDNDRRYRSSWTASPSRRAGRHRRRGAAGRRLRARRSTAVSGAPRLPYCMMGVCFDCLVTIDGVGNRQGCLVPVARACSIEMQQGKREIGTMSAARRARPATTSR